MKTTFPKVSDGENEHIHLLANLNQASSSDFESDIADIRELVYVRNCVVHAAGFVERYKFEKET